LGVKVLLALSDALKAESESCRIEYGIWNVLQLLESITLPFGKLFRTTCRNDQILSTSSKKWPELTSVYSTVCTISQKMDSEHKLAKFSELERILAQSTRVPRPERSEPGEVALNSRQRANHVSNSGPSEAGIGVDL
jgi:hypothetical protein